MVIQCLNCLQKLRRCAPGEPAWLPRLRPKAFEDTVAVAGLSRAAQSTVRPMALIVRRPMLLWVALAFAAVTASASKPPIFGLPPAQGAEPPLRSTHEPTRTDQEATDRDLLEACEAAQRKLDRMQKKYAQQLKVAITRAFYETSQWGDGVIVHVTADGKIAAELEPGYTGDATAEHALENTRAAAAEFNRQLADAKSPVAQRVLPLTEESKQELQKQRSVVDRLNRQLADDHSQPANHLRAGEARPAVRSESEALAANTDAAQKSNGSTLPFPFSLDITFKRRLADYRDTLLNRELATADVVSVESKFVEERSEILLDEFRHDHPWSPQIVVEMTRDLRIIARHKDVGSVPNKQDEAELADILTAASEFNKHDRHSSLSLRAKARLEASQRLLDSKRELVEVLNQAFIDSRRFVTGIIPDAKRRQTWLNDPPPAAVVGSLDRAEMDEIRRMVDDELNETYEQALTKLAVEQDKCEVFRSELATGIKELYDVTLFNKMPDALREAWGRSRDAEYRRSREREIGQMPPDEAAKARAKDADEGHRFAEFQESFNRSSELKVKMDANFHSALSQRYFAELHEVRRLKHRCDVLRALLKP